MAAPPRLLEVAKALLAAGEGRGGQARERCELSFTVLGMFIQHPQYGREVSALLADDAIRLVTTCPNSRACSDLSCYRCAPAGRLAGWPGGWVGGWVLFAGSWISGPPPVTCAACLPWLALLPPSCPQPPPLPYSPL